MKTTIRLTIIKARPHERAVLTSAARELERVVNGSAFAREVRNHRVRERLAFAENRGLDNAAILRVVRTGREARRPVDDFTWDIDVVVYAGRRRTVGYTYPGITTIYMNRRALDFSAAGVGGLMNNIAHEYCHKLGFDHEGGRAMWDFTVPYAIGNIVERIWNG